MIEILREFGPAVAAITFFIWRDWKREERTALQNNELTLYIRSELTKTLKENTQAFLALKQIVQYCKDKAT